VSKASSRQAGAFVIIHTSKPHQNREDVGCIQPDLCVDPNMRLPYVLLQQCHTIPGNANAPEDLALTGGVTSGACSQVCEFINHLY